MANDRVGIGVHISQKLFKQRPKFVVLTVLHGSPAEASGVQAGDVLTSIWNEGHKKHMLTSATSMDFVKSKLLGLPGSRVALELMRDSRIHVIQMTRAITPVQSAFRPPPQAGIGLGILRSENGFFVDDIVPGSCAARQKDIMVGDEVSLCGSLLTRQIVRINDVALDGRSVEEVKAFLRGPVGTKVVLHFKRDGRPLKAEFSRWPSLSSAFMHHHHDSTASQPSVVKRNCAAVQEESRGVVDHQEDGRHSGSVLDTLGRRNMDEQPRGNDVAKVVDKETLCPSTSHQFDVLPHTVDGCRVESANPTASSPPEEQSSDLDAREFASDWVELDADGATFFMNLQTRETAWVVPLEGRLRSSLRGGWVEAYDSATGQIYFYNVSSGQVSWTHPAESDALPVRIAAEPPTSPVEEVATREGAEPCGHDYGAPQVDDVATAAQSLRLGFDRSEEVFSVPCRMMVQDLISSLLLGNNLSGEGGASQALAISLAITNTAAPVMGALHSLRPIPFDVENAWVRRLAILLAPARRIIRHVSVVEKRPEGEVEVSRAVPRDDVARLLPPLEEMSRSFFLIAKELGGTEVALRSAKRSEQDWWRTTTTAPQGGMSAQEAALFYRADELLARWAQTAASTNAEALAAMAPPLLYAASLPPKASQVLAREFNKRIRSPHFDVHIFATEIPKSAASDVLNSLDDAILIWRAKGQDGSKRAFQNAVGAREELRRRFGDDLPQTRAECATIRENADIGLAVLEALSRVMGGGVDALRRHVREALQSNAREVSHS